MSSHIYIYIKKEEYTFFELSGFINVVLNLIKYVHSIVRSSYVLGRGKMLLRGTNKFNLRELSQKIFHSCGMVFDETHALFRERLK